VLPRDGTAFHQIGQLNEKNTDLFLPEVESDACFLSGLRVRHEPLSYARNGNSGQEKEAPCVRRSMWKKIRAYPTAWDDFRSGLAAQIAVSANHQRKRWFPLEFDISELPLHSPL
jgi:hypothetical protein